MEILVTGAAGFIGGAVVKLLIEAGHRVRAFLRPSTDPLFLNDWGVDLRIGDITERGSIAEAARGVEAVIHAAARVSLYGGRLEDLRQVNVVGMENVASVALEVGASRFVHVSSVLAVGASPDGRPVDETFEWPEHAIRSPYLTTKREAELRAFRYAKMGMDVVVVNPCLVVGAPDPRGVDPAAILKYLRRELPLAIEGGANYVDLWDVAHGIVAALDRGRSGERYLLGGENLTYREAYAIMEKLSGIRRPRIAVPRGLSYGAAWMADVAEQWTGRKFPITRQFVNIATQRWFVDSSKARRELGMPHTPIEESMAQAISYYRENGMV